MENKIRILKDNQEVMCDVLFTLNDEKKNEKYIIYTDNTKDKDGNVQVYASKYNNTNNLLNINSAYEKKIITEIINIIEKEVIKNENK